MSNINENEMENFDIELSPVCLQDFQNCVESTRWIPTGFNFLDSALGGGLYDGLYVIGAAPSLGKTTFCLQMADQLASRGENVLFFSLEQSELELVSKILARRTAEKDIKTAVTSLQIRRGAGKSRQCARGC